jgi:hypothetical protein
VELLTAVEYEGGNSPFVLSCHGHISRLNTSLSATQVLKNKYLRSLAHIY